MIWILTVSVVALGIVVLILNNRVESLESVSIAHGQLLGVVASPKYHEIQRKIARDTQKLHDMVLKARATGNLDLSNKVMEMQRWADCDYESQWLDGMFRGFP